MNHTPSKPTSPPSKPGHGRPWPPRVFAIGAVLLLVVSGLVVVISGLMHGSTPRDAAQEQASYASDALARINTLGSLDDALRSRDLPVDTDIGAAEVAALAKELADAQTALHNALAAADNLPALPEGYMPGTDVGLDVPQQLAGEYKLPDLGDGLHVGDYAPVDGITGDLAPAVGRTGLHTPGTGNPTVDEALGQLVGACAALRDMVGPQALPAAPVPVPVPVGLPADPCAIENLDSLPVSDPVGGLDGLGLPALPVDGLGGLVPSDLPIGDPTGLLGGGLPGYGSPSGQVQGANDAVDPDEAGAIVAQLHAGKTLGSTDAAYGQANKTLSGLLASYSTLATQLQDVLAQAQDKAGAATDGVPVLLQEHLAAITQRATELRADAERLAGTYERTARTAADNALGVSQDAVKTHMAALQSKLDTGVAGLNSQATQLVTLAGSRSDAITTLVDSAVGNLTRMSADSGIDATAQIAAIQASGDAAKKSLEAQAKAGVESLKETAALMQAQAQAAVPRLTAMGLRATTAINGTVDDALAKASDTRTYLLAFATAQADMATAAEQAAATHVTGMIQDALAQYSADVKAKALALVSGVPDVVNSTAGLVDDAKVFVDSEVGKDVDYIGKVATDYSKVPTSERKARAMFWTTVTGLDSDAVSSLADSGDHLTSLAQQVEDAAALAKADVEAIAA